MNLRTKRKGKSMTHSTRIAERNLYKCLISFVIKLFVTPSVFLYLLCFSYFVCVSVCLSMCVSTSVSVMCVFSLLPSSAQRNSAKESLQIMCRILLCKATTLSTNAVQTFSLSWFVKEFTVKLYRAKCKHSNGKRLKCLMKTTGKNVVCQRVCLFRSA